MVPLLTASAAYPGAVKFQGAERSGPHAFKERPARPPLLETLSLRLCVSGDGQAVPPRYREAVARGREMGDRTLHGAAQSLGFGRVVPSGVGCANRSQ